jgi:hypothetical protein
MVELYCISPIRLHDMVLNSLSIWTTLTLTFTLQVNVEKRSHIRLSLLLSTWFSFIIHEFYNYVNCNIEIVFK